MIASRNLARARARANRTRDKVFCLSCASRKLGISQETFSLRWRPSAIAKNRTFASRIPRAAAIPPARARRIAIVPRAGSRLERNLPLGCNPSVDRGRVWRSIRARSGDEMPRIVATRSSEPRDRAKTPSRSESRLKTEFPGGGTRGDEGRRGATRALRSASHVSDVSRYPNNRIWIVGSDRKEGMRGRSKWLPLGRVLTGVLLGRSVLSPSVGRSVGHRA
jgi:hypothetical protein